MRQWNNRTVGQLLFSKNADYRRIPRTFHTHSVLFINLRAPAMQLPSPSSVPYVAHSLSATLRNSVHTNQPTQISQRERERLQSRKKKGHLCVERRRHILSPLPGREMRAREFSWSMSVSVSVSMLMLILMLRCASAVHRNPLRRERDIYKRSNNCSTERSC